MEELNEIKISVRNLVESVLRSGDLDTRFMGASRALEGTKAHQKLQKGRGEGYTPEVSLKHSFQYKDFNFIIDGRADGILKESNEIIIEEIKSTTGALEFIEEDYNILHWAQAKCYGLIYSIQNNLEHVLIQLTYFQLDTEETKCFRRKFSKEELSEFIYDLLDKYTVWAKLTMDWQQQRDTSIKTLQFPFDKYRNKQRDLAVSVYRTVLEGKKLYVQAPTGIGKTISTLFPAVKALGEGKTSKLFYLTAKTITRSVAEEAFFKMQGKGLKFKTITLTAKDKICFEKDSSCNPEQCQYAKGHFDRINDALLDILENETIITREIIENYARKYMICPFEFSLDVTLWTDCVICDYNYVFDPRVYLKRFFQDDGGDYTFLIDEAHNLVDRAREMFSTEINKRPILNLKKAMKLKEPRISKALNKLNSFMIEMRHLCEHDINYVMKDDPKDIYPLLRKFISESEEWLTKNEKGENYEELLELYFNAMAFIRISELYDERYVTYIENTRDDLKIKLFCLDPSFLLKEAVRRGRSAVFFSATLSPMKYFKEILGGEEGDYSMRLPSPFSIENRSLIIANNISTKYKYRDNSYDKIVEYINAVIRQRRGNYIVFFPSYQYMKEVYNRFSEKYNDVNLLMQSNSMSEEEREEFLSKFEEKNEDIMLAFGVLGGIFSEGIDLRGERLIGTIIVGVGLPQICFERDIIKDYFEAKNGSGYEYSYMYPGMNKVLQAAGRVIRSEEDMGVILLIDDRFTKPEYQVLFPREWISHVRVSSIKELERNIKIFWDKETHRMPQFTEKVP